MKNFVVKKIKCNTSRNERNCIGVASIKYECEKETKWLSVSDFCGTRIFCLSDNDISDLLMNMSAGNEEDAKEMQNFKIETFEGLDVNKYWTDDISSKDEDLYKAALMLDLLIELTLCDAEQIDEAERVSKNKCIEDIDLFGIGDICNSFSKERLYKHRLNLEAVMDGNSYFQQTEPYERRLNKRDLKITKSLCEDDFEEWKKKFTDSEFERLKGKKFYTCDYMFFGTGMFSQTIPEEQLDCFKNFIDGCGGGFMSEPRAATDNEIKEFIKLHAEEVKALKL